MAIRIFERICSFLVCAPLAPMIGYSQGGLPGLPKMGSNNFHDRFNWKPEKFFSDPAVVELCHAIKNDKLDEIDRLIAAGANVRAIGKGGMTPLMWPFPDNKFDRFKKILDSGADPNVVFTDHLDVPNAFSPGDCVTCLCARTTYPKFFIAVMENGGDPNAIDRFGSPILHQIIAAPITISDAELRLKVALEHGADQKVRGKTGFSPAMAAASIGKISLVFILIDAGADPFEYAFNDRQRLVHAALNGRKHSQHGNVAEFDRLLQWLKEHGEDIDEAREDIDRWQTVMKKAVTPDAIKAGFDKEIKLRKEKDRLRVKQQPP